MGIRPMFKLPSYNVFDYKPRTYDPKKEQRREHLRQLREEQGKDMETAGFYSDEYKPGSLIRGNMMRPNITRKSKKVNSSNIRLIIILAALFFLGYIIFVADLSSFISFVHKIKNG